MTICYVNTYDKIDGNRVDHNAIECADIAVGLRRIRDSVKAYAKDYKQRQVSKPVYHVLWIENPHVPENSLVYVELTKDFWTKDNPLHYSVDFRLLGKEWQGYKRYHYQAGTLRILNNLIDKVTPKEPIKPIDPDSPEGKRLIKRNELLRQKDRILDDMRRTFGHDKDILYYRLDQVNQQLRNL